MRYTLLVAHGSLGIEGTRLGPYELIAALGAAGMGEMESSGAGGNVLVAGRLAACSLEV